MVVSVGFCLSAVFVLTHLKLAGPEPRNTLHLCLGHFRPQEFLWQTIIGSTQIWPKKQNSFLFFSWFPPTKLGLLYFLLKKNLWRLIGVSFFFFLIFPFSSLGFLLWLQICLEFYDVLTPQRNKYLDQFWGHFSFLWKGTKSKHPENEAMDLIGDFRSSFRPSREE